MIDGSFELYLLISTIAFNLVTLLWAGLRVMKVRQAPRVLFPIFFSIFCALAVVTAYSDTESLLRKHLDLASININVIDIYALTVVLVTHTDIYVVTFFYTPLYIIT